MVKILDQIANNFWFIILLVLLAPSVWALLVPGFYGASDDLHIAWLYEMDRTLKTGQFPPRFVPDLSFGFGYPLFNFVFPLPFYIGELFHLTGLNLVDSIKAVFLISTILSGFAMYYLLRNFTNVWLSIAGSVLYVYGPYRAVDLYIRGAIGEIVSFLFLPLIALSIIKVTSDHDDSNNLGWVGVGALSIAALILTHNITAYMFMPFIVILGLVKIYLSEKRKTSSTNLIATLILGLAASVYFWGPALLESNVMKYDTVFNFVDHFPTIKQLLTYYWGYGASLPGPYDGMSFFLGVSSLLVLATGIILFKLKFKQLEESKRYILLWAFLVIATALFMMNHRSAFIWSNLPLISYFQFPWRFLILTTFAIPLLVILFDQVKYYRLIGFLIIALTIGINFQYFRPEHFLGRTDNYYLERYIPLPKASDEYKGLQEEYLRLSKYTDQRPKDNFPIMFSENLELNNINEKNPLSFEGNVFSDNGGEINVNKYFFPGWMGKLDGKEVDIYPGQPYGQITMNIPADEHKVEVYFQETSLRSFLNILSGVAIATSLLLVVFSKLRRT